MTKTHCIAFGMSILVAPLLVQNLSGGQPAAPNESTKENISWLQRSTTSMQTPNAWSLDSGIRWQIPIPGRGASSPAIGNQQIYVSTANDGINLLHAYDANGSLLWNIELGEERAGKHRNGTAANPSPVATDDCVIAYFKSGDIACVESDGSLRWKLNLQSEFAEDTLWWDLGTSPIIVGGKVIVAIMQSGPSFILALDLQSGAQVWKADRIMPGVSSESNQAYTTPVVVGEPGEELLVSVGADHATGHRASDGKEVWRVGGLNPSNDSFFRSISSPVVAGDLVICPYARGGSVTAIRWQADLPEEKRIAWQRDDLGADVPTPVFSNGRVYINGDKGELACLEAATGRTQWAESLPKNRNKYYSSPVVCDGKVYCTREDGVTFVLSDSDAFELLATNELQSETVSTPIPFEEGLLIRTFDQLFLVGE